MKNRIEPQIETAVIAMATDNLAYGQLMASNELRKQGIFISLAGVRCVWLRHDLETFKKRLKALEFKSMTEGLVLTEAQVIALERAKEEKLPIEIETHHPGYLGAQDTYYVGIIKGVGWIISRLSLTLTQRSLLPSFMTVKTPLWLLTHLMTRLFPSMRDTASVCWRVLTDRGTKYCGAREYHEYQLYLALEDIDHSRTKAKSSQTNGICERINRTIQDEFYAVAFRKKIYNTLEDLQADLDT